MDTLIDPYLADQYGTLNVPENPKERYTMARALPGYSFVNSLDHCLEAARDKMENPLPATPYIRDNAFSRKDRYFREAFANMDPASKKVAMEILQTTVTSLLFDIPTNFDQFDFGELSISLLPKSSQPSPIELTSPTKELHDELSYWIYSFSKFKDELVAKEDGTLGTSFRLL